MAVLSLTDRRNLVSRVKVWGHRFTPVPAGAQGLRR
ncbi:hypothetical protein RHDE110596_08670 [Prescottella defluvii]